MHIVLGKHAQYLFRRHRVVAGNLKVPDEKRIDDQQRGKHGKSRQQRVPSAEAAEKIRRALLSLKAPLRAGVGNGALEGGEIPARDRKRQLGRAVPARLAQLNAPRRAKIQNALRPCALHAHADASAQKIDRLLQHRSSPPSVTAHIPRFRSSPERALRFPSCCEASGPVP